jgi:hypothetical protein
MVAAVLVVDLRRRQEIATGCRGLLGGNDDDDVEQQYTLRLLQLGDYA